MTPVQFAKAECANYQDDGSCLGVGIADDGKPFSFGKRPKCVLALAGVRCGYFEQCVMLMGSDETTAAGRIQSAQRAEAVKEYRLRANVPSTVHAEVRVCPVCNERPLEHGKRLCYVCRETKRRSSYRSANERRNNDGPSTTEVA